MPISASWFEKHDVLNLYKHFVLSITEKSAL